ncbi:hypothetical protein DY000_02036167 [Brassica cretica]|uniref:Secreted protein n=1 Tax=Brassica cretica TaxID=69181 RepID=A0ABQ7BFA9_BRACR|nr:hypothetical protein DY000_02036167 [Brassica cretica]
MILAQLPSVLLRLHHLIRSFTVVSTPASPCHRSLFFRLDKARFTNLQVTILFHGALNKNAARAKQKQHFITKTEQQLETYNKRSHDLEHKT